MGVASNYKLQLVEQRETRGAFEGESNAISETSVSPEACA